MVLRTTARHRQLSFVAARVVTLHDRLHYDSIGMHTAAQAYPFLARLHGLWTGQLRGQRSAQQQVEGMCQAW